jgi:hypothetical protein
MGQDTAMDEDSSIKNELAMDEAVPKDNANTCDGKKKSQRSACYTGKEDQFLCKS